MNDHPVAYLEAEDIVIYWDGVGVGEAVPVGNFYIDRASFLGGRDVEGAYSTYGRCNAEWEKMTDAQRVEIMLHYAFELIAKGYDSTLVIRECCKVRQFYDLAATSYPLRRAFSTALIGRAMEDWPPMSGEV